MRATDKSWSQEETDILKVLWAQGVPVAQIREKIPAHNRNSIIGKANNLGLPAHPNAPVRLTEEEKKAREEIIARLWEWPSLTIHDIAGAVGLSISLTSRIAKSLNLPRRHGTVDGSQTPRKAVPRVSRPEAMKPQHLATALKPSWVAVPNPLSRNPNGIPFAQLADDCCGYELKNGHACGIAVDHIGDDLCAFHKEHQYLRDLALIGR